MKYSQMKKISCLLIFFFLLASCKRSFQYKLDDFGTYYTESINGNNEAHCLPKCWDGWFELRVSGRTEVIDGVKIRKFDLDPNFDFYKVINPTAFEFYCYIAFIDDQRLVFYTPYKNKVANINAKFNLFDSKEDDFQRGYYIYKHKERGALSGQLEVLLENRKRETKTELIFEVEFIENTGEKSTAASLKLIQMNGLDDTQLESNSPDNKREYKAEELFSFQPTYYFEKRRSLEMSANKKNRKLKAADIVKVDSIFLDRKENERLYYLDKKLQFKEELKGVGAKETLKSW